MGQCIVHKMLPAVERLVEYTLDAFRAGMEKVRLCYIIVQAYMVYQMDRMLPSPMAAAMSREWKITRAYLYNEDGWEFDNATDWFIADKHWKEDISDRHPDWPNWKLDLRYTYAGQKYRMVLRPTDEFQWPPLTIEEVAILCEGVRAPHGILAASLIPKPGIGAKEVNVTQRVQKYAGITRDFGGSTVYVKDLFPMDDHEDNEERFLGLRIISISPNTGLCVRFFEYTSRVNISEIMQKKKIA